MPSANALHNICGRRTNSDISPCQLKCISCSHCKVPAPNLFYIFRLPLAIRYHPLSLSQFSSKVYSIHEGTMNILPCFRASCDRDRLLTIRDIISAFCRHAQDCFLSILLCYHGCIHRAASSVKIQSNAYRTHRYPVIESSEAYGEDMGGGMSGPGGA